MDFFLFQIFPYIAIAVFALGSILRFETERSRLGNTSVTYEVVVKRDDVTIFSTDVTLVNVDESGNKEPIHSAA